MAEKQNRQSNLTEPAVDTDWEDIRDRGVLRVILEYNSIGYFIYKGQPLGYEYELIRQFAKDHQLKMEVVLAGVSDNPYTLLNEGKGDIIANGQFANAKTLEQSMLTLPYRDVEQVIVQRQSGKQLLRQDDTTGRSDTLLRSAIDLSDRIVYVADNSIYYHHLKEISDSLGINIDVRILSDDRSTDDIIQAVANYEINYTIANKDVALLNQSYFENLDVSTSIGKPESLHWAVRKNAPLLLGKLNEWIKKNEREPVVTALYNKYFSAEKNIRSGFDESSSLQQGMISHYDALIQQYAQKINWDWRLVAALIHQESKFNPMATSWAGAQGLMQLMPGTAKDLGVYRHEVYNPERNIYGGTKYLKQLEQKWSHISDFTQRIKFILASYNAGIGHVMDAARLAEKYGYSSDKWDGAVEYFILYKSNPRFYNDPVVKYGYCRGQEPFDYVRRIIKKYFEYQSNVNLASAQQTPQAFRLEQVATMDFNGIEGIYNPTQGLIARSARRELFLSHKLFDEENPLIVREKKDNPFEKKNKELFSRQDSGLFNGKKKLFQPTNSGPANRLTPKKDIQINKLTPKR